MSINYRSRVYKLKLVHTFAFMRKITIAISAVLLALNFPVKAQFNTVTYPNNRCNVGNGLQKTAIEDALETREMEMSDTDSGILTAADIKKKEQIARYLSVCYPLSSIKINSSYGYRKDPFSGKLKFHNGLDLHARNAKVYAMLAGKVIKIGQDRRAGKYVTLKHGNFTVSYCHLSRILAYEDQIVKAGDTVGITGNTGRSTGEHLHITCKHDGDYIDPMLIFKHIETVQKDCIATLSQL